MPFLEDQFCGRGDTDLRDGLLASPFRIAHCFAT